MTHSQTMTFSMRWAGVLQRFDGDWSDVDQTPYYKNEPSLKTIERHFKGRIKKGMRLLMDSKVWDDLGNEPYELADRITLKNF